MKTTILTTLTIFLSILTTTAQEINPIRMGQFFEQGYGRAVDDWADEESALDIQPTANGLIMSGWVDTDEAGGKNMALWQIDEIGRLTSFGEFGYSGVDQIAAAVAPHSTSGYFLAGRQSAFYTDADHSTINSGDEALIKFVSSSGTEAWSLLVDSAGGGGGDDTNQVAVDVINDGNDDFLVLINRQYGEFGLQDFRVMMLSASGNIYWDKRYSISNTNVFAQKIVKRTNGHYLILANDVDNGIPILYEISGTGVYETHEEYPQGNAVNCFGITNNTYNQPSSGYRLAGFQDNGADKDGFIIEVDNGLTEQSTNIIENPTTGNESFRDIVAHPTGYIAIGECDNKGEGQRDVWICHLDSLADTLKVETLGGEEIDYGQSVALIPSVYSAFIAGYNNSYTVEESGNAYLGGVKVDMGFPESGPCKLTRVLWVDKVIERPDKVEPLIIGNSSDENALIQFAKDNGFTHLALFDLGLIFDTHNDNFAYIKQSKIDFRKKLDLFIVKCNQQGIYCGMVTDKTLSAIMNAAQFNIDHYNFKRTGKLQFQILEHEFWNASGIDKVQGSPPHNPPTTISGMNQHFLDVWSDHQYLLSTIGNYKKNNANFWNEYDYMGYSFHRWDATQPPFNGSASDNVHDDSKTTARSSRISTIETLVDGVFLHHYTSDTYNNGKDFLNSTVENVPHYKKRLSFFGQQSDSTDIFPIFSGEWNNSIDNCGQGAGTDFLGDFMDDASGNNFRSIEQEFVNQYSPIYNSSSGYPNIKKVSVSAVSWFKYSCLKHYDFKSYQSQYDNNRLDCPEFTYRLLDIHENEELFDAGINIYPNPTSSELTISNTSNQSMSRVIVSTSLGKEVISLNNNSSELRISLREYESGIYFIRIFFGDKMETVKVVKQ